MGVPVLKPTKAPASWPKTLDEAKAEKEAASKPAATWSQDDIAQAKAHCAKVLKSTSVVAIPEEPIREGACGAAAPVQLISVGRNPQVALSPPVTVTCDMAAQIDNWVNRKLQPLAKKHLGQPLIKIETMSSYSCRNAYGRAKNKLSEHARANAIDIRGFTTQTGKTATVLADWGMTEREISSRIAAAKAAQEKIDAQKVAQQKKEEPNVALQKTDEQQPRQTVQASAPRPAPPTPPVRDIVAASMTGGLPNITVTLPGTTDDTPPPVFGMSEPQKLGGPKRTQAASEPEIPMSAANGSGRASRFLRAAHDSACQIFGTTLGPEANKAHRNHLHIDMAERKRMKICR